MCILLSLVEHQYCSKVRLALDAIISMFTLPFSDKKSLGKRLVYIPETWHWSKKNCAKKLPRQQVTYINLASFFVSNARVLESMRFEIERRNVSTKWIGRQHRLLQIKKRAPRGAQFDFVSPNILTGSPYEHRAEQVHDLSADPFRKFH
jgi:hypothetical protein